MSKNFKNKALMGLAAGLTVAAATAQAGVTTTLAASCGAPQTRNYSQSANRNSCGAPSNQNNNNAQASNYNSCGAPKSYGYDNNTADNSMNRNPSWTNAADGQMSNQTPGQNQWSNPSQTQTNQGWTSQSNSNSSQKPAGYYYNGQGQMQTPASGAMNPNSTTNPMSTQPSPGMSR